jgi:hypothetical protein
MFGSSGSAGSSSKEHGVGQKRVLNFGPFRRETAKKQQVVSLGLLPKVMTRQHSDAMGSDSDEEPAVVVALAEASGEAVPAGVYRRESRLGQRRRASLGAGRALVFASGTKQWEGLRPERRMLDELVHQFFVLGKQFSAVDVLRLIGLDAQLVAAVDAQLLDLCLRIKKAVQETREDEGVPVLVNGGGRGMKVTLFHHPYLLQLQQVAAEASRVVSLGFSLGGPSSPSSQSTGSASSADSSSSSEPELGGERPELDGGKCDKRDFERSELAQQPLVI